MYTGGRIKRTFEGLRCFFSRKSKIDLLFRPTFIRRRQGDEREQRQQFIFIERCSPILSPADFFLAGQSGWAIIYSL